MTTFAAAGQPARLVEEAELHRLVSVALHGAQLEHVARAGLDHGDRHRVAALVKNLRHPDLAAE